MKKLCNSNKGITLIVLIVTIIVLLILAGISISAITGGDSTIDKAGEAKNNTEVEAEMEEIQNKINSAATKGIRHGNFSGSADAQAIKDELVGLVTDTSGITGNAPWQVTGSKTRTRYLITEDNELIIPTYIPKEYLKSTGTQYIDTGVIPANTVDFEMTFKTDVDSMTIIGGNATFSNLNDFFGSQNNDVKRTITFNFGAAKGEKYIYAWKNHTYERGIAINRFSTDTYNPRNQITISCINDVWKVNNNQIGTSASVGVWQDSNNSLYVFGYSLIQNNVKTIVPFYENLYVYSLKIWDNGTLVRDYIPVVIENYKNEPCLYDLVEDKYYFNQGTGTFETN